MAPKIKIEFFYYPQLIIRTSFAFILSFLEYPFPCNYSNVKNDNIEFVFLLRYQLNLNELLMK